MTDQLAPRWRLIHLGISPQTSYTLPMQQITLLSALAVLLHQNMHMLKSGLHIIGILSPPRAIVTFLQRHFQPSTATDTHRFDARNPPTLESILRQHLGPQHPEILLSTISKLLITDARLFFPFLHITTIMNATGKTMKDVIVFKPYENLFASMTVQAVEAVSYTHLTLPTKRIV